MLGFSRRWILLPFLASRGCAGGVSIRDNAGRRECIVTANGGNQSVVSNILGAFKECGSGGNIIFPESQNYWIDTKLNPVVNDVRIDWHGIWTVCYSRLA